LIAGCLALIGVLTSCTAQAKSPAGNGTGRGQNLTVTPASGTPAVPAGAPVPSGLLKHLPQGVFYILGGLSIRDNYLWEVTSAGREVLLTRDPRDLDSMTASSAGVVLSDAQHFADQLAMLTRTGLRWIHPHGHPKSYINGQVPDIRRNGQIVYEMAPGQPGGSKKDFTIWSKKSFTGPEHLIYSSKNDPGTPVVGPDGQTAVAGPVGPYLAKGQVPGAVIISRSGNVTRLRTGGGVQGYPPVWGDHAPALAIPTWGNAGNAQLYYQDGKRGSLPAGWRPLAWNPRGTELLVQHNDILGLWQSEEPHKIIAIGSMTKGFQVMQVSWLRSAAPL
jgi:hypothetical protein